MEKIYVCIDLKSFYASVECVERKLNPLTTNLVVADEGRTDKTICLAITPSLKKYGLKGRERLYAVKQKITEINKLRREKINGKFKGSSYDDVSLQENKYLKADFIIAMPRMKYYMKYSTVIYGIYLKYIAPEDIHVYSIDEVFCDITSYLRLYNLSAEKLVRKIILDIYNTTGITATAGIGTNMYLAKVAMDIEAKHLKEDDYGVRIAYLDEQTYREKLWDHKPLTDFWNIGRGISNRLAKHNIFTMGDIAYTSLTNEVIFYKLFGVKGELIIDHAWGYEPCQMKDIKSYKAKSNSLSSSQVLKEPYNYEKTKLIILEMGELISLSLVKKHLVTDLITLTIGYDVLNIREAYQGDVIYDSYGRCMPKYSHGTIRIDHKTSVTSIINEYLLKLFEDIIDPFLLVRKVSIHLGNLDYDNSSNKKICYQFNLFSDNNKNIVEEKNEKEIQRTILDIKYKYGKNAILKGMNLMDGATTIIRNEQVGGHQG